MQVDLQRARLGSNEADEEVPGHIDQGCALLHGDAGDAPHGTCMHRTSSPLVLWHALPLLTTSSFYKGLFLSWSEMEANGK